MYTYHYRLQDRYRVDVVSMAVLTDLREDFLPTKLYYQRLGL
ncbi:hypothetical protein ACT3UM_14760 [Halomonas sp. AOP13-D3-9]